MDEERLKIDDREGKSVDDGANTLNADDNTVVDEVIVSTIGVDKGMSTSQSSCSQCPT